MMRYIKVLFLFVVALSCRAQQGNYVSPGDSGQVDFALSEIEKSRKHVAGDEVLDVVFQLDATLGEQAYRIVSAGTNKVLIKGGDATGLMYGGLAFAEKIKLQNKIPALQKPIEASPYLKQRGLKFNIPLDVRTPSYQDAGDAAQNNILEMWNMDFWKQYLDMMARNQYNVLTLWNPHPFPSMIKMEAYPDVALSNVCGSSFPLDTDRQDEPEAKFIAGSGVSAQVEENLVVLKEMSIDEKIDFWREVMAYAKNRGVEVYFITWNIWMNSLAPPGWYRNQENLKGDAGKYGINNDQTNDKTIAYLRAAVKEFILTYPDLAGIGITAGENMEDRQDEYDREKWLWQTYGLGVEDAKAAQPDREVKFVHRFWQSGIDKMKTDFIDKYPDQIDLSFKYARARMYATPDPKWADEYIKKVRQHGLKTWWNIRNDDIFHFRWGDAGYASAFFKNIPPEEVTAGYFMGSDGYVWGREFISKHPQQPRQLEIDKHWYNFMLWGRMGYDPDLSEEIILGEIKSHYPEASAKDLIKAWATASQIPSLVTQFHWNSWDFMWAVEGCLDLRNGFHTVEDFITNPVMDYTDLISIPDFVEMQKEGKEILPEVITPLEIADQLQQKALAVLQFTKTTTAESADYKELIYDLRAWAQMGNYYAEKIRGAYYLHAYREGLEADKKACIAHLKTALNYWEAYASAASRNYTPQFLAKTRTIDWDKLKKEVAQDVQIAASKE